MLGQIIIRYFYKLYNLMLSTHIRISSFAHREILRISIYANSFLKIKEINDPRISFREGSSKLTTSQRVLSPSRPVNKTTNTHTDTHLRRTARRPLCRSLHSPWIVRVHTTRILISDIHLSLRFCHRTRHHCFNHCWHNSVRFFITKR